MQLYRLMGILVLLLRQETVTAPRLAERFEVSTRTIRRDVEALCQAGVPVITRQGAGGGISLAPGYRLDPALFTREELSVLLTGLRGLESVLPHSPAQGILAMLGKTAEARTAGEISVDLGSFDPEGLSRRLEQLSAAIGEGRLVRFCYASARGTGLRRVEPHRLLYRLSAWYLLGFCRERQDFRTFKLARITGLEVLEETFSPREIPPERLTFREYFRGEGWQLRALFAPEAAWRLTEEYGEGAGVPQPDGRLLLERKFVSFQNLLEWVLGFGDAVEVLEPRELREELRRQGEALAARYKEDISPSGSP